jgi:phosphoribosylformylglycinamidine synthase
VSDGGIAVALAEMVMAGGNGVTLSVSDTADHGWWFGEDQGRYILAVEKSASQKLISDAREANVPAQHIGVSGGEVLELGREGAISITSLRETSERWLAAYMDA